MEPLDEVSKALVGMGVRRIIDDAEHHALEALLLTSTAKMLKVGERFIVELFDSIEGIVKLVCSNPGPEFLIKGSHIDLTRGFMLNGLRNPVPRLQAESAT